MPLDHDDERTKRGEVVRAPPQLKVHEENRAAARAEKAMLAELTGQDLKEKLKSHRSTSADYKEKGQAILSDAPLRRNTANGLLNWQLKAADEGEASGSKRQRME